MALSLTVEDGTNVGNANSFATLAQIRAYNLQRGIALPDTDDEVIALAAQAMDYIAAQEARFAGNRTYGLLQPLSFPRKNICVYGSMLPSDIVPLDIVNVQCALVGIATEIDLYMNDDERAIIRDTVGPLTTQYSATQGASSGPILPTINAMLRPYCNGGSGSITSVRI